MLYDYRPNPELFDGVISVEIPRYKERLDLVKKLNITQKDGEVSVEQFDNISLVRDIVIDRIRKVELFIKGNGQQIGSMDDLEFFEEFNVILQEISALIFNGIKLGNAKKD
jgi:hypothetical protein